MAGVDALGEVVARADGHTSAPWETRGEPGESPAVWHDSETTFPIGRCADCGVEAVYAPADGALIEAAPKLLAALQAVEALAEQWRYKGEFGGGAWQEGEGPDQEGCVLDDVAAAIKAAVAEALQ